MRYGSKPVTAAVLVVLEVIKGTKVESGTRNDALTRMTWRVCLKW